MGKLATFLKDESGASAVEYGLIAGMISCVIITALMRVGTKINSKFNNIASALS